MKQRLQSYNIFRSIVREGQYSNLAIKGKLEGELKDKRVIHATVMGALDKLIYLDYIISVFAKGRVRPEVKDILRLALYQIIFMDAPHYAVCSEWPEVAQAVGKGAQRGYINGVLRAVVREKNNLPLPDKNKEPIKYLSVKYSYPEFLTAESVQEHGFAFTESMLAYQPDHYTSVRFDSGRISKAQFEQALDRLKCSYKPGLLYKDVFFVTGNEIFKDILFKSGICSVQSEPSMLVCKVADVQKGMRVLDCCAAPGGKSVYMASLMGEGELVATDIHEHRVELIKSNALRCGLENIIDAKVSDASIHQPELGLFDAVLVDAPCSGLGVAGGKPDIKLRITPEGLRDTENLQKKILDNASKYVRPGGTLIYSTCTVRNKENRLQAEEFLKNHSDFTVEDAWKYAPDTLKRQDGNFISLMPHINNTEGFFIARFIRKNK